MFAFATAKTLKDKPWLKRLEPAAHNLWRDKRATAVPALRAAGSRCLCTITPIMRPGGGVNMRWHRDRKLITCKANQSFINQSEFHTRQTNEASQTDVQPPLTKLHTNPPTREEEEEEAVFFCTLHPVENSNTFQR